LGQRFALIGVLDIAELPLQFPVFGIQLIELVL
jgi:hypothetical protein